MRSGDGNRTLQSHVAVVQWLKSLRDTHPVQTVEEEADMARRYELEPVELRNELVLRNLGPMVVLLRQTAKGRAMPIAALVSAVADALGTAADDHIREIGSGRQFFAMVRDEVQTAVLDEFKEESRAEFTPSLDAPIAGGRIKDDDLTGLDSVVKRIDPVFLAGRIDRERESDVASIVECTKAIVSRYPDDLGFRLFRHMFLENMPFDASCEKAGADPDEAEELLEQTANIVRDTLRGEFGVSGSEVG